MRIFVYIYGCQVLIIQCISIFQNISGSVNTLGVTVLESRGFPTEAYWYWIGVGALLGFVFLFNIGYTLCLQFLNREYHFILCIRTAKYLGPCILKMCKLCSIWETSSFYNRRVWWCQNWRKDWIDAEKLHWPNCIHRWWYSYMVHVPHSTTCFIMLYMAH